MKEIIQPSLDKDKSFKKENPLLPVGQLKAPPARSGQAWWEKVPTLSGSAWRKVWRAWEEARKHYQP